MRKVALVGVGGSEVVGGDGVEIVEVVVKEAREVVDFPV